LAQLLHSIFPIMRAINDPSLGNILPIFWIAVAAIGSSAILMLYLVDINKCLTTLNAAYQAVKEYGQAGSAAQYSTLFRRLEQVLGQPWSEFQRNLVHWKTPEGETITTPLDVSNFLNEDTLFSARMNRAFYAAVPGLLTGWGILGTFVGLTLGLQGLSLEGHNVEALRAGVQGLLSGMDVAFTSSLWGILFSIILSVIEKVQDHRVQRIIKELQKALGNVVPYRSTETWLADVLWEAQQQTTELKNFNEQLAIDIAAALEERLAERLTPALEKLLEAIDDLTQTGSAEVGRAISNQAGEALSGLAKVMEKVSATMAEVTDKSKLSQESLYQAMQQNIEDLRDGVGATLEMLRRQQVSVGDKVEELLIRMAARIEDSMDKHQTLIQNITSATGEELTNQIKKVTEEVNDLVGILSERSISVSHEVGKQLTTVSNMVKGVAVDITNRYEAEHQRISELLAGLESASHQVSIVIAGAKEAAAAFQESANSVLSVTNELRQASAEIFTTYSGHASLVNRVQAQLEEYCKTTESILNQITEALEVTRRSWAAYESRFEGLRKDLETVFDELAKGLQEYSSKTNEGVEEFLRSLDKYISEIVNLLTGAIEELKDVTSELPEAAEELKAALMSRPA